LTSGRGFAKILGETESVDLYIEGRVVGRLAVADLLPGAKDDAS
jgi:hypothetical protein